MPHKGSTADSKLCILIVKYFCYILLANCLQSKNLDRSLQSHFGLICTIYGIKEVQGGQREQKGRSLSPLTF